MKKTDEMSAVHARPELLQVADVLARDKGIDIELVFEAMEVALQKVGRSKYGSEYDIRVSIDRNTGEICLARYIEIVSSPEDVLNELMQVTELDAQNRGWNLSVGEFYVDPLPPVDFGRVAAQVVRQIVTQRIREAERQRQYADYKERIGEIVNGVVKRSEFGNVIVDLGKAEAVLRRDEMIPRERFYNGDRIRAWIMDVRSDTQGAQIFLSRTHPEFLIQLFKQEVPEIYDDIIEIVAAARDPGSRAKITVRTQDSSIDPVGACVGLRGARVQAVVNELQGEKIDIIQWTSDIPTLVVNALAPAEVSKVVVDEDANRIEVVVPDSQLSLAIGRRGQNVRLASQLTSWNIDVLTESAESERRAKEFQELSHIFVEALDVDDVIAHLLVAEGFSSIEEIGYVPVEELLAIEGFGEEIVEELQSRSLLWLKNQEESFLEECASLGIAEDLKAFEKLPREAIIALGKVDIKTLNNFADLSTDELFEIIPEGILKRKEAEDLIMKARSSWFPESVESDNFDIQETVSVTEESNEKEDVF